MTTDKIFTFENLVFRDVNTDIIKEGYFQLINDDNRTNFLSTSSKTYSVLELERFIELNLNDPNTYFFQIRSKSDNAYLGNCKLTLITENNSAEFGRLLFPHPISPKGTGTKIIRFLQWFSFEFLKLNKITSGCELGNIASFKSNLKAGMTLEGTFLDHVCKANKAYVTVHRFGVTRSSYLKQPVEVEIFS